MKSRLGPWKLVCVVDIQGSGQMLDVAVDELKLLLDLERK